MLKVTLLLNLVARGSARDWVWVISPNLLSIWNLCEKFIRSVSVHFIKKMVLSSKLTLVNPRKSPFEMSEFRLLNLSFFIPHFFI
jgi:hypothetical protein